MAAFSDRLNEQIVTTALSLPRYDGHLRRQILALLKQVENDMIAQLEAADLAGVSRQLYRMRRAEALIKQIRDTIERGYTPIQGHLKQSLLDLADIRHRQIILDINKTMQAQLVTTALPPVALRQIVKTAIVNGSPLDEWWGAQKAGLRRRFAQQIRIGVTAGETVDEMVARIRGRATGRRTVVDVAGKKRVVREFAGGIMDTTKREAETLVRTAVQTVSNNVLSATYEDNADIIKGKQWVATLDSRTCVVCASLDGGSWDLGGDPLPESSVQKPYPGDPPIHPSCRCTVTPITKGWDELSGGGLKGKKRKALNTVPDSVRASMDGEVSGKLTFEDWFSKKPRSFQESVLGPGRYDLWKKGRIGFQQLVDQQNRPLTLDQLRASIK